MTISELIERLEALKAEHGDCPVFTFAETGDMIDPDPGFAVNFIDASKVVTL